jgi:uncharacterized phage protein (TIGR01671 family)
MREIKFRAWHDKEKIMFNVSSLDWNPAGLYADGFAVGTIELMQYTGLRDKNGKEIYEGDIVKTNITNRVLPMAQFTGKVNFENGGFNLNFNTEINEHLNEWLDKNLEVIGNIYENKELFG